MSRHETRIIRAVLLGFSGALLAGCAEERGQKGVRKGSSRDLTPSEVAPRTPVVAAWLVFVAQVMYRSKAET